MLHSLVPLPATAGPDDGLCERLCEQLARVLADLTRKGEVRRETHEIVHLHFCWRRSAVQVRGKLEISLQEVLVDTEGEIFARAIVRIGPDA